MRPRHIQLQDGSIMFLPKGNPPTQVDGFVRDPQNEFHFIPNMPPCTLRVLISKILPCKKVLISDGCQLGHTVSFAQCSGCKDRK